ncbi:hypothetical protein Btru_066932 [Bulinus truncatus]|nr:hypothetical protein Btru_066932 [Bulinus truncatus]
MTRWLCGNGISVRIFCCYRRTSNGNSFVAGLSDSSWRIWSCVLKEFGIFVTQQVDSQALQPLPPEEHQHKTDHMTTQSRRLLIAMDNSKHSDYAFDWYMKFFYKPKDELILFHCLDPSATNHTKNVPKAAGSSTVTAGDEEEAVNPFVAKLHTKAATSGIRATVVKAIGSKPGEAIIKASEEQRVDIIITGSRGIGALKRTFAPSVSEYVVHQSVVPVLVIRQ